MNIEKALAAAAYVCDPRRAFKRRSCRATFLRLVHKRPPHANAHPQNKKKRRVGCLRGESKRVSGGNVAERRFMARGAPKSAHKSDQMFVVVDDS